jgi:hypothetical protein
MRPRSWPAALGLAAGALAAMVGPVGTGAAGASPAAPGAPEVPARSAPAAPPQVAGEARIELVDQSTWLDEGQPFEARVRVTRPPAGASVRVDVHERLLSRIGFQDSLGGDLGSTEIEVAPRPLAQLPARGAGTLGVGFTTDGSSGASLDQGVYPVEIQVLDGAGAPAAEMVTYVVVRPPESPDFPALAVGVVLDAATPPALQPDGTVEIAEDDLERIRERTTILQNTDAVPLTLAPRPETLDGLADLADSGLDLLAELDEARGQRPVLARPYTDVDIAALMASGHISELNAQAEGGANVVRNRFGIEPTPGMWLADGTLGGPAAQMLVELGVGRAIVPPEAVGDVPGVEDGVVPAGTIQLGDGGPITMVSDPTLGERLTGDDGVLGAQRFVAELAMLWLERPADQRGVVVHVPADARLDTQLVQTALAEVSESRILSPVTLDALFGVVPPADGDAPPVATPANHEASSDLTAVARRIDNVRARAAGYAGTIDDPDAGRALTDSLLLATGSDTPDDRRHAYVDRVMEVLTDLSDVVSAPPEFRITLTSRSGSIPLNLTNDSSAPVNVRIELESDQLAFPDGDVMEETLQPGGNPVEIRVRTRTSGAFPLNIVVTSPDGSIVLERTRFDIRSTTVSGVGLVLSIGAGLFLAVWWARHWRKTRRAKRLVPTEDIPAVAPPGTPARGQPVVKAAPPDDPPGPGSPGVAVGPQPPPGSSGGSPAPAPGPPPPAPGPLPVPGSVPPVGPVPPASVPPGAVPPGPVPPGPVPPDPPGAQAEDADDGRRRKRHRPAHMAGNRSRRR